jgi:hypothetical protein
MAATVARAAAQAIGSAGPIDGLALRGRRCPTSKPPTRFASL